MNSKVYTPEPALKDPGLFFREGYEDILSSFELSIALAKRDISAMYRQSYFGYVWAFLPVLATTAVFLILRSGGAFKTSENGIPYPVYLLVGSLLWQIFADAVNGPLKIVGSSRAMIVKIKFPREALIIAGIWITLFNFVVRLAILIPALFYFANSGQYEFSWSSLALFPLGTAALILLGYMFGILLTPVGILYKDVSMGILIIMNFWMFLSPVVTMIPADDGWARSIMLLNPVSPILDTTRSWLVGNPPEYITGFVIISGISMALLFIGWVLYRVSLPHVISRLGM